MTHNDIAEAIYLSTVGKSEHELSEVLKNAIRMLFRRRLLSKSGAVVSALQKIIYKKNNTVEVLVRSSEPLGHATKALLKAMLEKKYKNKKVPALFAGTWLNRRGNGPLAASYSLVRDDPAEDLFRGSPESREKCALTRRVAYGGARERGAPIKQWSCSANPAWRPG